MTTPTPIELAPWQFEIGGVVLGKDTSAPVGDIEGLGSPSIRAQDEDNPVGDGTYPGQDLFGPRTVRIEAGIKTPGDPTAAADLLARLERAVDNPSIRTEPNGMAVLRGRWPGHDTRRLYGRLRRMEATSTANAVNGWIPLDIEFDALDPYWHADIASHLSLALDQAARPRNHAESAPARGRGAFADAGGRPGWITNAGDAHAWPRVRITGPVARPRLWNTVTGRALELDVQLRAGEWVEIETRPGTRWVLRNGTTNEANSLTPDSRLDHFSVPPGRSEIAWTAEDATGTCRLDLSWRSAYTAL
ncbi:phage tail family protein [Streptomyces sp. PTM05]|uniref:Phage tail family protein n=1 Tax=Streptantibioticus parmotrematis TaxID=2873249 RepID=A0ABS7QSK7_9ACTN|nr:phage tail domain-containing protein [Streptantibioticus parmotrematis]MBY8884789.1 phage tail family protein [Streptantibioticus parmotrematis]